MSHTTDRNDPDLGYGSDDQPTDQNKKYLVLSEEERAKGFVRPLRDKYIHVGRISMDGYVGGCNGETKMSQPIAETYATNPKFYGSTYCVHCRMHRPVEEFVWSNTTEFVGS